MKTMAQNSIKYAKIALFLGIFGLIPMVTRADTPTLSLIATPQNVTSGEVVAISWFSQNTSFCVASGAWSGRYSYGGSLNVYPEETSSYTITCNGPYGSVSDVKTVFVNQRTFPSSTVIYSPTPSGGGSGLIPIPTTPIPIAPPANTFTAACAASQASAGINKIVSFAAAHTGGFAPVVYRWSGDVTGSEQVVNATFERAGVKTAKITVTDSRGLNAEGQCSIMINAPALPLAPTPTQIATVPVKKPTVVVAQTQTCKTITICMDASGNVTQKDASCGSSGNIAPAKEENKIETAENGNGGKKFFLASLFGGGNGNGNAVARNFTVYLLPVLAAVFLIFIGYIVVRMSRRT